MEALAFLGLASTLCLLTGLCVFTYNLRSAPRLETYTELKTVPKVSVLLPARDEAINLSRVLPLWAAQDYPDWELLVLDDQSSDETWEILGRHASTFPLLRRLPGEDLPRGWRGKNWACHQLSKAASGEIFLFADCDVEPGPLALRSTVAALQAEKAHAISALGCQRQKHWAAKAILPLVLEIPLSALLPLRLVSNTPYPSLSAAIGQWLGFTRQAYSLCGGHEAVADETVEDLALARNLKAKGLRLSTLWARDSFAVEMYNDFPALWRGFSKNLSSLAGKGAGGRIGMFCLLALFYLFPLLAPFLLGWPGCIPLALLLFLRLGVARLWGHPPSTLLWHLPGTLLALALFSDRPSPPSGQ